MEPTTAIALYGQGVRQGIYRWFATNPWPGDAVLAVGFLLLGAIVQFGSGNADLGVLAALPLFVRRSFPVPMFLASLLIELLILAASDSPLIASSSALLVIYATVVYPLQRFWGYLALAAGVLGAVLAPIRWYYYADYSRDRLLAAVALLLALVAVSYIAGDRRRADREFRAAELAALAERARLVTLERDQRVQFAAASERTRIARELHDIVAHSLAVIVVQADGGAAAAAKNPAVAEPVLRTIAETSRQALNEMRALVGVLRSDPVHGVGPAELLPQPGIAGLARLVDQTRQAGVTVTLHLPEPPPQLSPTIDLTVYRIVQEGLTNVLKHAGPAATAEIEIAVQDGEIAIEVVDDGRGAGAVSDGLGNGIQGIRERVAVLDGAVWAGPRPGGGYRLRAAIPFRDAPFRAGSQ